jgi:hypothetical protein
VSNDRMINELKNDLGGSGHCLIEALFRELHRWTEDNHEDRHLGYPKSRPGF